MPLENLELFDIYNRIRMSMFLLFLKQITSLLLFNFRRKKNLNSVSFLINIMNIKFSIPCIMGKNMSMEICFRVVFNFVWVENRENVFYHFLREFRYTATMF